MTALGCEEYVSISPPTGLITFSMLIDITSVDTEHSKWVLYNIKELSVYVDLLLNKKVNFIMHVYLFTVYISFLTK